MTGCWGVGYVATSDLEPAGCNVDATAKANVRPLNAERYDKDKVGWQCAHTNPLYDWYGGDIHDGSVHQGRRLAGACWAGLHRRAASLLPPRLLALVAE